MRPSVASACSFAVLSTASKRPSATLMRFCSQLAIICKVFFVSSSVRKGRWNTVELHVRPSVEYRLSISTPQEWEKPRIEGSAGWWALSAFRCSTPMMGVETRLVFQSSMWQNWILKDAHNDYVREMIPLKGITELTRGLKKEILNHPQILMSFFKFPPATSGWSSANNCLL